MRLSFVFIGVAVVMVLAASAAGQPVKIDPELALAEVRAAYATRPWCERAVVGVRRVVGGLAAELAAAVDAAGGVGGAGAGLPVARDRAERRAEIVARFEPRWPPEAAASDEAAADEAPAQRKAVWLEMGDVWVAAEGGPSGSVTAVHARNEETFVRAAVDGELRSAHLAEVLPPVPLPQLDLALGDEEAFGHRDLTPYAPRIRWLSAVVDNAADPRRITLTGRTIHGVVSLVTDAATGRLVEFACDAGPADESGQQVVVVVRAREERPPQWSAWPLNVEGRRQVASLRDLAPTRPTQLRPGTTITGLPLLTPEGAPWSLASDLGPIGGEPAALVLLLVRSGRESGAPEAVAAAARSIAQRAEEARTGVGPPGLGDWPRVSVRPVAVISLAERDFDARLRRAAEALGPGLLWTISSAATIDRLAPPDAPAALMVIDSHRTMTASLPVDDSTTPEAVDAFLTDVLRGKEE